MKSKVKKLANWLFRLFAFIVVILGVVIGCMWYQDYQEMKYWERLAEKKGTRQELTESDILPEYQALYQQNQDLIGWIKVENTKIDYPVMQTKEQPQYYLRRNFDEKYDSMGTPFADYRCEVLSPRSYNVIVYGHYTDSGGMFRWLLNYNFKGLYERKKFIQFDTLTEKGIYEIVAAFYYDASETVLKDVGDEEKEEAYEFYNYIETNGSDGYKRFKKLVDERKLYETESDFDETDELLTLICCAPKEYSESDDGRFVVIAKKLGKNWKKVSDER